MANRKQVTHAVMYTGPEAELDYLRNRPAWATHASCSLTLMAKSAEEYREKLIDAVNTLYWLAEGISPHGEASPNFKLEQYRLDGEALKKVAEHLHAVREIVSSTAIEHMPDVRPRLERAVEASRNPAVRAVLSQATQHAKRRTTK
jgi:hypothetical protein